MKKNILITSFILAISLSQLCAQVVSKEKVLYPVSDKDFRGAYGIKPLYPTSGNASRDLTPIFEFGDLKEDGFIFREKFHFSKFNNDFEKVWESDIEKEYTLQSFPYGQVEGNSNGTYYYECSTRPGAFNQAIITKFSNNGKITQVKFQNEKRFTNLLDAFVNSKGFNFFAYKIDTKAKLIFYYIITFDATTLAESVTELPLPSDEYEFKHHLGVTSYYWFPYAYDKDRIIFGKSYVKKSEGSKVNNEVLINLAEYSPEKKIVVKEVKFANDKVSAAKFIAPNLTVDLKKNSLYVTGLMSTAASNTMDAIYCYKYDLTTGSILKTKEIPLTQLTSKMGFSEHFKDKSAEEFPKYVQSLYASAVVDEENNFLTLVLDGGPMSLLRMIRWNYTVTLDENWNVCKIDEFNYEPNPDLFEGYKLVPKSYTTLYIDKTKTFKARPIDYLLKQAGKAEPGSTLYRIFPRENSTVILSMEDKGSEVRAVKIAK